MLAKKLGAISAGVGLCGFCMTANAIISAGSQSFIYTPSGWEEWVGTDSDVVFYLHDTSGTSGTFFVNLTDLHGVTIDGLMSGSNHTIQLNHAGLDITNFDSWGFTASSQDITTEYDFGMVGVTLGTLFVSGTTPSGPTGDTESTANQEIGLNTDWINQINTELAGEDSGLVSPASLADYSSDPYQSSLFTHSLIAKQDIASLYFYGILDLDPEPLWFATYDTQTDFHFVQSDLRLQGDYLLIGEAATVPIPASAYFFLSGIASLTFSRFRIKAQ